MGEKDLSAVFSENLADAMRQREVSSPYVLARMSGVSKAKIYLLLSGEQTASLPIVEKLARALRVSVYALLTPGGITDAPFGDLIAAYEQAGPAQREMLLKFARSLLE